VATGTYTDTLLINIFNTTGDKISVPSVTISVTVTAGINPNTEFSLANLPTCSLNSIEMNLNNTYKLTCANIQPNIQVRPIIDTIFITGIGVTENTGQYIYEFKPKIAGNSEIKAEFLYKNAPIGTPYTQGIKITQSGSSPITGINLDISFYQDGKKKDITTLSSGSVDILVKDEKTGKIITSFIIYLNGRLVNTTFNLDPDRVYELIVDSSGYLSKALNFSLTPSEIQMTLSPAKSFYNLNDVINVTTTPEDASILYDNQKNNGHLIIPVEEGVHIIRAIKEGYVGKELNITVKAIVTVRTTDPPPDQWEDGGEVKLELSKETDWKVLKDSAAIFTGKSNLVVFTIDGAGTYTVEADGTEVYRKVIENTKWSFPNLKWRWWYSAIIIAFITLFYFLFIRNGSSEKKNPLVFNLGDEN
ncbi:MAG: hypothetical protein AABY22_33360, partial [Nanoarchaeota archaeon]